MNRSGRGWKRGADCSTKTRFTVGCQIIGVRGIDATTWTEWTYGKSVEKEGGEEGGGGGREEREREEGEREERDLVVLGPRVRVQSTS